MLPPKVPIPQIVIPMSGFGERFRRAGYRLPKPLIPVDGRPIIEHVVDMFPGAENFVFICSQEHLDNADYRMRETLERICPTGRIVGILPHKLGPIHAVLQATEFLDPDRPVVVNYCDFSCYWDWHHFVEFVRGSHCDGAVPAYRGFHPHSLGTTNYAYMRESGGWMLDIQEKQPFTDDRMQEYASSGTYYFRSARLMATAFDETLSENRHVGGEFYVSLAYKSLLRQGMRVAVYELQHFLQWGTPADLEEYQNWSNAFQSLCEHAPVPAIEGAAAVFPMAGMGERFSREGYTAAKPLIQVSGEPMAVQSARDLPTGTHRSFVLRADMPGAAVVAQRLTEAFPGAVIVTIAGVTQGQACTAQIGLDALKEVADDAPVTFGVCDAGVLYDKQRFVALANSPDWDVVVWTRRGHPHAARNPQMYGWIAEQQGVIERVSVKVPLSDPLHDPIVLGIFTFRNARVFRCCLEHLLARDGKVNGEFYLDSVVQDAIELGLVCRTFEVDSYFSWGTPNDLRTFEYWQSCFSKMASHPYELAKDQRIAPQQISALQRRYAPVLPTLPDLANLPQTHPSA
ncbi:2-C-methyl-D-erythritol 4-phosphate cytidylyltransferase [Xylophilus ampelinus]|nr:NTP transferase domain-containing protein [Variovorax sp.]VTY36709.1 2-C-methyl-D-erythritol 4-phosphate cytidylyltransferase [Xylophilus ampelinus]